ncbi:MAG: OmpA family protein [Flavobacteriales bacterium]|nr:OmpA family protein [Flavobacteriales bacterium]MDG1780709.1 OmpA family protein [Flavobacteriales bacterium]MDG2244918.1 OmpA family protein [Flavobacteriales bacterium]
MRRKIITSFIALSGILVSTGALAQFTQEKSIAANEVEIDKQVMNVTVFDSSSKKAVEADVSITGLNPRKPVVFKAIEDTTFEIRNYRLYTVSCVKEGYMYYSEKFWPEEKRIHEQDVELRPLAIGLKTDVREITFLGNRTEIYHKSKPSLQEIIDFMAINPSVKIAIIGHVNGPDNSRSAKFYVKASLERAQTVIDYLVENGVDEERLMAKGMGNTEMLYNDPSTDWQNEANRRIEIEVIGL